MQGNWSAAENANVSGDLSLNWLGIVWVFVEVQTATDFQGNFVSFVEFPGSFYEDLEFVFDFAV